MVSAVMAMIQAEEVERRDPEREQPFQGTGPT